MCPKITEIIEIMEQRDNEVYNAEDISSLFSTESIRVFTYIIYFEAKHILMVKTW